MPGTQAVALRIQSAGQCKQGHFRGQSPLSQPPSDTKTADLVISRLPGHASQGQGQTGLSQQREPGGRWHL